LEIVERSIGILAHCICWIDACTRHLIHAIHVHGGIHGRRGRSRRQLR
jgi:hypothetical protein